MQKVHLLLQAILLFIATLGFAQTGTLQGKVMSEGGYAIPNAVISIPAQNIETVSDSTGFFTLSVPAGTRLNLRASALGYELEYENLRAKEGDTTTKDIKMNSLSFLLDEAVITNQRSRNSAGSIDISPINANLRPDPTGGIEGMLKILVGSRNELTSQYTVRGGNYDENLVYVNDFEIYRPFLVRSGQQEGLSFVNPDLVGRISFSTGGFKAQYGDKISSVLDIDYKTPQQFGGSAVISLLGAQAHLEGASRDRKFTYLIGVRQKTNQYLLKSQPTKGQYNPSFLDLQTLLGWQLSTKVKVEVIANYARNRFNFEPDSVIEYFGYVNQAYKFSGLYEGAEVDQFDASFLGTSIKYLPNEKTSIKILASTFQTNEFETYDLAKSFLLSAVETDLGKSIGSELYSLGSGTIMQHARNYLDANVVNVEHKGTHSVGAHFLLWGAGVQLVSVRDKLSEWELRDSAGYTQPNNPDFANLYSRYTADNQLDYTRLTAYVQDNILLSKNLDMVLSVGARASYSLLNKELIISPRVQYSVKPRWEKDVVFRLATGLYAQPPFYREMRDLNGPLNTNLKAQKSIHVAGGFDYNFKAWGSRPFKLTGELFYKYLYDLVPYEYQNVRIRYFPENIGQGYSYGGELRLFGDLVKDAESWVSFGYLKTENRFLQSNGEYTDYFARPTDQRLNFGMYFSDYLPRNKNFKMFLNLLYSSGLPFSVPGKALQPGFQLRIPDYKRVDIGFATLLLDGSRRERPTYSLFSKLNDIWLSLEVFNLLGIQNTLSYQFIQPVNSTSNFAVPNRLTGRLINLKLAVRF